LLPLDQIGTDNFNRLKVAWTWRSPEEAITKANPDLKTWMWESTPLMVGGVLYVSTSMSQVAAIDAATGKTRWVYDPETWKGGTPSNNGFVHRGVAYWANMATTPFTLVGNSADSRGLAQCRATVCCTLPNDHAQQPGPLGELHIPESEHAAPVGCSVLILMEAPSSADHHGRLALGIQPQEEEETS
jgi:hypothetical protein